jgi:hypothetical protein
MAAMHVSDVRREGEGGIHEKDQKGRGRRLTGVEDELVSETSLSRRRACVEEELLRRGSV